MFFLKIERKKHILFALIAKFSDVVHLNINKFIFINFQVFLTGPNVK